MTTGLQPDGDIRDVLVGAPRYSLTINGTIRKDLNVVTLTEYIGMQPSVLELVAPEAVFNQNVVKVGDYVQLAIYRTRHDTTYSDSVNSFGRILKKFSGQVVDIIPNYSFNNSVRIMCKDFRDFFFRDKIQRDYNKYNKEHGFIEETVVFSARTFVQHIVTQFLSRNSDHPDYAKKIYINYNTIPETPLNEQQVTGVCVGEAMEAVAIDGLNGKANWILTYPSGSWIPVLSMIDTYQQNTPIRNFKYGTDPEKLLSEQPFGVPNVTEIQQAGSDRGLANRIIILGDYVREQRMVKLLPKWNIPNNSENFFITGYYPDEVVPEPNPRKLTEYQIQSLLISWRKALCEKTIKSGSAGNTKVQNFAYTPEAKQIGAQFIVDYHLMWDSVKSVNQDIIDTDTDLRKAYLTPYSNYEALTLETAHPEWFEHCSWLRPKIETELFQVPVPRNQFEVTMNESAILFYRFYSSILGIGRRASLAAKSNAHYFDPTLWERKNEGLTISNNAIRMDEALINKWELLSFLTTFPASVGGDAGIACITEMTSLDAPLGVTIDDPVNYYTEFGLVIDITWGDIIQGFDDLFGFDNGGVISKTGNHFLRQFCTSPPYWTNSGTEGEELVLKDGAWETLWDELMNPDGTPKTILTTHPNYLAGGPRTTETESYTDIKNISNKLYFYELPYEIYLNTVVIDTTRVKFDSGYQNFGAETIDRVEVVENTEFQRRRLGPDCVYIVDYTKDYENLGSVAIQWERWLKLNNLPIVGNEMLQVLLSKEEFPFGWELVHDGRYIYNRLPDGTQIMGSDPTETDTFGGEPVGVRHLDQSAVPIPIGIPNNAFSKMGREAVLKLYKSLLKDEVYTIEIPEMDLESNPGDRAILNGNNYGEQLRITTIVHMFFGGDPQSSNHSTISLSKV
jgi:hypothetical protein